MIIFNFSIKMYAANSEVQLHEEFISIGNSVEPDQLASLEGS